MVTPQYKEARTNLTKLSKRLNTVFNLTELKELSGLKQYYLKALKLRGHDKLELVVDVLLRSSSHRERLTQVNNELTLIDRDIHLMIKGLRREVTNSDEFFAQKKQDRDLILDLKLGVFVDFQQRVEYSQEVVGASIDYLDKLEFNLKTIISSLKYEN